MNNTVNIKAAKYEPPVLIHYVQGSTEIPLEFNITDYEIPSGSTARIYLKRPDGTESYNDCTIDGNVITYKPTAQFFSVAGICTGQLQIMIGDDFLVTFPLVFDVAENIIDDSAIESSNEYGALEALLQEAQENIPAAGEAAEAANQAATAANNAANAANQAAQGANTAAGAANDAKDAANSAAQDAMTAAGQADDARDAAQDAADEATAARDSALDAAEAANTAANQAMLKKVKYYSLSKYQDILDTAIDSSMLVGLSSTNNAGLYEILDRASFAWVYQFFVDGVTATNQRVQIAFAFDAPDLVAYRVYQTSSGFTDWGLINNSLLLPDDTPAEGDMLIVTAAGVVWGKVIYPNQVTVPGTAGSLMVGSNDYAMTAAEMQQLADALGIEKEAL